MFDLVPVILTALLSALQSRSRLCLENLALRHQLLVLQRQAPQTQTPVGSENSVGRRER
jgi:hypothetical protein